MHPKHLQADPNPLLLLFSVMPDSPVPIFEQIIAQITFAVAAGDVEPGNAIPSVRDLAEHLLVHPNTVAKAYQLLAERGIVTARRGRGMEVTQGAPALCREQRRQIVQTRIRQALREAVASQLPAEEIRRLVREELERANGRGGEKA